MLDAANQQILARLMRALPESARDRSVEANSRLWNETTKGDTFSSRLEAQTQATVEILDPATEKHVVPPRASASLKASQLSITPTGFEALPPDDLNTLSEYKP